MEGEEEFRKIQAIEDSLYISGTVLNASGKCPLTNVDVDIWFFNKLGEWLKGHATTDDEGHYAFSAPNMNGDWTVQFVTSKDGGKIKSRVTVDRNFSPMRRYLSPYEIDKMMMSIPNIMKDTPDSLFSAFDDIPLAKRKYVLPAVKVNAKRRIFDGARAAWESESVGEYGASIYYDMIEETQKVRDEGKLAPGIFEWLYARNPNFTGTGVNRFYATTEEPNFQKASRVDDSTVDEEMFDGEAEEIIDSNEDLTEENLLVIAKQGKNENGYSYGQSDLLKAAPKKRKEARFYGKDLSYNNRPIFWVLNNNLYEITGTPKSSLNEEYLFDGAIKDDLLESFPQFIDEVNAIYVSDSRLAYRHIQPSVSTSLESRQPVTIHVYTHVDHPRKLKGHSSTRYHAFDKVDTFVMDDYSVLPPMEDFRRTLFWNPNIRTDAKGNATVEFYNNSSARHLYISAEGMTSDGHILVNE